MKLHRVSPRVFRVGLNLFPAFRGTGGRVVSISDDWRQWRVKLPLNWRTRNYVGTIFGGSLYGAVDPQLMIAWKHILGPEYVVWDKAAVVRFKKPGRATLWANIHVDEDEVEEVKRLCEGYASVDRTYQVDLVDGEGVVHCEVEKTLYFRRHRKADSS